MKDSDNMKIKKRERLIGRWTDDEEEKNKERNK